MALVVVKRGSFHWPSLLCFLGAFVPSRRCQVRVNAFVDATVIRLGITSQVISAKNAKTQPCGWVFFKAGEAIRTPDIHVGNVTLYH